MLVSPSPTWLLCATEAEAISLRMGRILAVLIFGSGSASADFSGYH
jgi:hypothetical protein